MRTLAAVLLAVACFYAFWCGAMAVRSYWHLSDIVDMALEQSGKVGAVTVRETILKGAAQWEVPIDADDIVVAEDGQALSVRIKWTWPVITYKGDDVLQIPLSLERSYRRR
jgi:hypothetical protein